MTQAHLDTAFRGIASARHFVRFAVDHGAPAQKVVGGILDVSTLDDPDAVITLEKEIAIVRRMLAVVGDEPGLGLRVGMRYHLTTYGIWGFALLSQPTLNEALRVARHYRDFGFAFTKVLLERQAEWTDLRFDDGGVPVDVARFLVERDIGIWLTIAHDLLGEALPVRAVRLRQPAPPTDTDFTARFGAPVTFDAPDNVVSFEESVLHTTLPQADSHTAARCEQEMSTLRERRRAFPGIAMTVRAVMVTDLTTYSRMAAVAANLGMTTRTLHRRLTLDGSSFRDVLELVRRDMANELLTSAGLTVEQTARQLGYADTSSFVHAYRRWTGTTPGQLRQVT
jgi:AraC-like DNA-binding protein